MKSSLVDEKIYLPFNNFNSVNKGPICSGVLDMINSVLVSFKENLLLRKPLN